MTNRIVILIFTLSLLLTVPLCAGCGGNGDNGNNGDNGGSGGSGGSGGGSGGSGTATLVISDAGTDLQSFNVLDPNDTIGRDSEADELGYVYLYIDQDAVRVVGPWLSAEEGVDAEDLFMLGGSLFILENESIAIDNARDYWADGFVVTVNSHLTYSVSSDDFEYEIALAQVQLTKGGDTIRSEFIFAAIGDGVAHDIVISALVDGAVIRSTDPVTIESREAS